MVSFSHSFYFFLYSDASLKRIDFEVKYKGSSAFTLGIPVSGYCYDKKYTDNIDFVYIWTVNNIYYIAIVYIDTEVFQYSENTSAIIWYI